jgi:hypothetical protein
VSGANGRNEPNVAIGQAVSAAVNAAVVAADVNAMTATHARL